MTGLLSTPSSAEEEITVQRERLGDLQEALLGGGPQGFTFLHASFFLVFPWQPWSSLYCMMLRVSACAPFPPK